MLLMFRCKTDKLSDISLSKKFWNSSGKMNGVLKFWMLVLKKWRYGSQELSSKMSPELSEGSYFSVSNFRATCQLVSFSFVYNSIGIEKEIK